MDAPETLKTRNAELEARVAELESQVTDLRAREAHYRTIADFTHDWEYWISPDKTFLYMSPSCERITGYPPTAFMDDPALFPRIAHPEDRNRLILSIDGPLSRGESPSVDFRIFTASGELRWISNTCRPIFDPDGRFLGRRGSNRDITGRVLAEATPRMSEARYQAMFDGITSCVAVYEPSADGTDFIFKDFNRAAEKSSNLSREEVLGKSIQAVFPAAAELGLLDVFRRVHRTGRSERLPLSRYRDDRVDLWVENHVYKLPAGELVAVYDDVTAEKRSEADPRRSEERLELALEAASDGIWDWDIPTGNTYFSPRYFTMLGYAPDELPSHFSTWENLVHPEDGEKVKRIVFDHIEQGKPYEIEFRFRNKAGEWQWVLGRGKVMERDADGKPIRMVGTHVDIHERKVIEERLIQRMRELEALNALSHAAALNISLDHVVEAALSQVKGALAPDLVVLFRLDGDNLKLLGHQNDLPDFDHLVKALHRLGACLCGRAAAGIDPLFSSNINEDPRCTRSACRRAGIRAFAGLPLVSRGAIIGVLSLGSCRERDFSKRTGFLKSLAALVATGIANALLHQRVQTHADELENLVAKRTAELKKFQNAVVHSHASIVITDPDGTIEYVNPFFTRLTGYTPDEALGRNPRILKSGHHDASFYQEMWGTLLSRESWRGELRNRKKDGSLYWEDASISPLLDESGRTVNYVAVKEDITEKKRAEKAIKESERRYKTVFNASRDGIFIADIETKQFRYVNEAGCRLMGYTLAELLTRSVADIHPEADLPWVREQFGRQVRGEIDLVQKMPCRRKDGSVFYCDVTGAPVTIDGRPCLMGFFRDVTDRIEAAELKDDVDRIMRHDLKSPLNGIIGLPELLLMDDNLTEDQRESLRMIKDSGRKMLDMINLSLTIFQIESGTYEYTPATFDLIHAIRQVMADNRTAVRSRRVDMHLSVHGNGSREPARLLVNGEELLAFSIFSNLITNAVEASPRGEAVEIDVRRSDAVVVSIWNMGAVPSAIRDRFFDKYVTSGKKKGTGLGTYSARLLSEVQGWTISMETEAERGTTVSIRIPV